MSKRLICRPGKMSIQKNVERLKSRPMKNVEKERMNDYDQTTFYVEIFFFRYFLLSAFSFSTFLLSTLVG